MKKAKETQGMRLNTADFYLAKKSKSERKLVQDSQRRKKVDMNSIQNRAKKYVNDLANQFETNEKNNVIHKLFFRYNGKVHRFYEELEKEQGQKLSNMLLKYEKIDFMQNQMNLLISSYKVSKHITAE